MVPVLSPGVLPEWPCQDSILRLVCHIILDLKSTPWHSTRKSAKTLLHPEAVPPKFPIKWLREQVHSPKTAMSSIHHVKDFTDDFTVISSSLTTHQDVQENTVTKCMDLNLQVHPDKCVNILYNGKKLLDNLSVQLTPGKTNSIYTAPIKLLIGYTSQSHTARLAVSSHLLKLPLKPTERSTSVGF